MQTLPIPWAHLSTRHSRYFVELRRTVVANKVHRLLVSMSETVSRTTYSQLLEAARRVGFEIVREHCAGDDYPVPEQFLHIREESVFSMNQLAFLASKPYACGFL
ncbi:hypothetical protein [Paraburkholderia heleia]|uniref:hypothetical protein n=1 Tax=Paraburkholderia heleia TaxID=634127 RepID=UPI002AB7029D|nr:hypothetical protein [Paraburkholderia heleia]